MDLQELDQAVQKYFAAGITPATHKTYLAAERRYLNFCHSFSLVPLPTSEVTLFLQHALASKVWLIHP